MDKFELLAVGFGDARSRRGFLAWLIVMGACHGGGGGVATPDAPGAPADVMPLDAAPLVAGFTVLTTNGGRVDWSAANQQIAFDRREASGCYDVNVMSVDGAPGACVSCASGDLPSTRNVGQPAWDPTGRYLVLQVEQPSHPGVACGVAANPGAGIYSDLWILDVTTSHAYPIVTIPTSLDNALLHAHFSNDGKRLSWSQMISRATTTPGEEFGLWQLEVADVVDTGGTLSVANTHPYSPNGSRWYENHGFSPDGSTLIFTSSEASVTVHTNANIYTMNVASGAIDQKLTTDGYNEHGQFSSDGAHLVWMHGTSNETGTEWWIMNPDGTAKRQVSSLGDPTSAEYQGQAMVAADLSWVTPTRFVGTAHAATQPMNEPIYRFDLAP